MPTSNKQRKLKKYIYTHKNQMHNIGLAMNLKGQSIKNKRKATLGNVTVGNVTVGKATLGKATLGKATLGNVTVGKATLGKVTLGKATLGKATLGNVTASKKKDTTLSINKFIDYTKQNDKHFAEYSNSKRFKSIVSKNPTIFIVNAIFLTILKSSFISRLLNKENEAIFKLLESFIVLSSSKSKIVEQLLLHGFNTIYDILLENTESVYLYSFCAHAASLGLIDNPDKFIVMFAKNKLHEDLSKKEVIEQLQLSNLYTRVKRFQLV
jgi:hypothetical protein